VIEKDTAPDTVTIADQTELEVSTDITEDFTITGINAPAEITITNGVFVDANGNEVTTITVENNDTVTIKATTSDENSATVNVSVTDEESTKFVDFNLTTKEADNTAPTAKDYEQDADDESSSYVDLVEKELIKDAD